MAKGKHAAASANRRLEAAQEHIDRLTDQLAEAKLRARMVERQADRVPRLEEQVRELQRRLDDDDIAREFIDFAWELKESERLLLEYVQAFRDGVLKLLRDRRIIATMTIHELIEYASKRHPKVFSDPLKDGERARLGGEQKTMRGLSEAAVTRLQEAQGKRHVGVDVAALVDEYAGARDLGFTTAEALDLLADDVVDSPVMS